MPLTTTLLNTTIPDFLPFLDQLRNRRLVQIDPYVEWTDFADVVVPSLGPILKHAREEARTEVQWIRDGSVVLSKDQDSLEFMNSSSQVTRREKDVCLDPAHIRLLPYDPWQWSKHINEDLRNKSQSSEAIRGYMNCVFEGFPPPVKADEDTVFSALLSTFDHLLGDVPQNDERLNRLGIAARAVREVGDWLESIPLSSRGTPDRTADDEPNTQLPADVQAHTMITDVVRRVSEFDHPLSEENRADWRWICEGRSAEIRVKEETEQWTPLRIGDHVWLFDPLDGSLIWQIGGNFAVSIAIGECVDVQGIPTIVWHCAAVCLPKTKELMVALVGGGGLRIDYSNCRISPLRASAEHSLLRSKVAMHLSRQEKNRPLVERFIANQMVPLAGAAERLLMYGSGVMQMSYVGSSQLDSFISVKSGGPWDYMAASILVAAGGGIVRNFLHQPLSLQDSGVIAAGSLELYENLRVFLNLREYCPEDFG